MHEPNPLNIDVADIDDPATSSSLIQNVLAARLPTIDRASGVWVTDAEGRSYIDGSSGAVVANIGHADPRVVKAISDQAAKITFSHRGAFTNAAAERVADRIAKATGYDGVWFVNSGSEAVEAAMQFALQYFREQGAAERSWFLSHDRGYHGNTLGALSLSGHIRRSAAGPLSHPFSVLPAPYSFREQAGRTDAEYTADLLAVARTHFEATAGRLAGVVIEPMSGATLGATVPPDGYLAGIRDLCDEYGALLIADEVMTGMGRTGRWLAMEHWGVEADLTALGKGLGAGYTPIAATLVRNRILEPIRVGSGRILGGHTYGANPLSAATADAVLDVLIKDGVVAKATVNATYLRDRLVKMAQSYSFIADVRGKGMLLGVEFDTPSLEWPPGAFAMKVASAALIRGLVLYTTTAALNDVILIAPPLTIEPEEIDLLVDALDLALHDVATVLVESLQSSNINRSSVGAESPTMSGREGNQEATR